MRGLNNIIKNIVIRINNVLKNYIGAFKIGLKRLLSASIYELFRSNKELN